MPVCARRYNLIEMQKSRTRGIGIGIDMDEKSASATDNTDSLTDSSLAEGGIYGESELWTPRLGERRRVTDANLRDDKPQGGAEVVADYFSRFLSLLLHPYAIPTYAMLLLFFGSTVIAFSPLQLKLFFIITVMLNTLFVPLLFNFLIKGRSYRKEMDERRMRVFPLIVTTICFAVAAYILPNKFLVFIAKNYMMALTACALLATFVSWFWKISLHMVAIGSLVALLFVVTNLGLGETFWAMVVFILLAGCVGSARLYLKKNDLTQVLAGFIGGVVVTMYVLIYPGFLSLIFN